MSIKLPLHRDYGSHVTCAVQTFFKNFADNLANCFRQFYSKYGTLCPSRAHVLVVTRGTCPGAFVRAPIITASRPHIARVTSTTNAHHNLHICIIRRSGSSYLVSVCDCRDWKLYRQLSDE